MSKRSRRSRVSLRTEDRHAAKAACKAGRSILDYASLHSVRLDMLPASTLSHERHAAIERLLKRSGAGSYLERRLRSHPGKRCSFSPIQICAAAIISVSNGWSLEITDLTRALNSIHRLTRRRLGLHDELGYFVSYRTVNHQFNRLADALRAGWRDPDGTWCDTDWLVDRLITASLPEGRTLVEAIALDGLALESFGRIRWPELFANDETLHESVTVGEAAYDDKEPFRSPEALAAPEDEDDTEAVEPPPDPAPHGKQKEKKRKSIRPKASKRKDPLPWTYSLEDRRPVPSADPDARLGHRTVTYDQPTKFYNGYELHVATQVRTATWHGDPRHITLGPTIPNYILGMKLTKAVAPRDDAGVTLIERLRTTHPDLNEVILDRGYTQLSAATLHDPIREMGISLVMDYKTDVRAKFDPIRIPIGRRKLKHPTGEAVLLHRTAGSLFHEFMPAEFLTNPAVPWKNKAERKEAEEFYNRRAAYVWTVHSKNGDGTIRLACPVHSGRLRPLDPAEAAMQDKIDHPHLEAPPGTSRCCEQPIITTLPSDRGHHYQEVPYGTTAWSGSNGRRSLSETSNSVLRSGLARLTRNFFRVFGQHKITLLVGLCLASINLKMTETEERRHSVVVVDDSIPGADFGLVIPGAALDEPEPQPDPPPPQPDPLHDC